MTSRFTEVSPLHNRWCQVSSCGVGLGFLGSCSLYDLWQQHTFGCKSRFLRPPSAKDYRCPRRCHSDCQWEELLSGHFRQTSLCLPPAHRRVSLRPSPRAQAGQSLQVRSRSSHLSAMPFLMFVVCQMMCLRRLLVCAESLFLPELLDNQRQQKFAPGSRDTSEFRHTGFFGTLIRWSFSTPTLLCL